MTQAFPDEEWCKDARHLYEKLRKKKDKFMLDLEKQNRQEAIEELEKEGTIKNLDDARKLVLTDLIEFLFNNFPARHHKRSIEKPKVEPGKERKACVQLSALYHPDKVTENYGKKYKVLCEEISKRINERLGDCSSYVHDP